MARPPIRPSPHPLTPPLTFYLGLSLFLLSTPLIPHFSLHLHHWVSQAMLTYSFPRHHVNLTSCPPSIPTFRSHYKPHSSSVSSEQEALSMASKWAQRTVVIPAQRRGCHLVTSKIVRDIEQDLSGFKCGIAHFFLQHTSASLTINENYDSDVQDDTETFLNRIVPEGRSAPWKHTLEGPDDMPAHIKSSMFGCSLTIPITDGRLNMGTWQGIWLCEHRDHATPRKIVITMNGM